MDIGIITAPRRFPTLAYSLESLRAAGVDGHIYIFAEPGSVQFTGSNLTMVMHPARLGAFRNYDYALGYLLQHGKSSRICVLEDDYIYSPGVKHKMADIDRTQETFGYFNLFTNGYHPGIAAYMAKEGWNKVPFGFNEAWGVAYVFPRDLVPAIRAHEFYQEIMEKRNRVIDGTISEVLKRMGLPMWYHNPSLVYSIGFSSTLGNEFKTDGYRFRGK